jgi:serine/threonine-protein phosphatase 4 regulatory subunit 1
VNNRLYLVRELPEFAQQLGCTETQTALVPILLELQQDAEPVIRQALVEQLPSIALQLLKVEEWKRQTYS